MTDFYDVIVVGGGPAGSTAAYTLASQNVKVCLIDKSAFPRDKLCGGLVSARSIALLEHSFQGTPDPNLFISSHDVIFKMHGDYLCTTRSRSPLYFTMRIDFDASLLQKATAAGTNVRAGESIAAIDPHNKTVSLAGGNKLAYRFLIGADGVNSQVAKTLFGNSFDPETIGFGLEIEVPDDRLPTKSKSVEIDFDAAHWGYGWVFPKKTGFTLGVGGIHAQNPDMRGQLERFVSAYNLHLSEYRVKGQYIPFGDYRSRPVHNNVFLCGDAAGLVDPITGEGIAYAIQSGAATANAILKEIASGQVGAAQASYIRSYKDISRLIRQANLWRNLIFPKHVHHLFSWTFADASTLQGAYLDILGGTDSYDSLPRTFILQGAKGVRKLSRRLLSHISGIGNSTRNL
jgi:geranylgeranyl reductase family protein